MDQNSEVRNDSASTKEPARISVAQIGPAPPTWNIGRVTSVRSSGSMELLGMKVDHICNDDDSTPLDAPVVPEV